MLSIKQSMVLIGIIVRSTEQRELLEHILPLDTVNNCASLVTSSPASLDVTEPLPLENISKATRILSSLAEVFVTSGSFVNFISPPLSITKVSAVSSAELRPLIKTLYPNAIHFLFTSFHMLHTDERSTDESLLGTFPLSPHHLPHLELTVILVLFIRGSI